jgi:predicted ATPase/class 3 adenylate cyclase
MTTVHPGTITFLFSDIERSTHLWERYPDAMRDTLARHDELLRRIVEQHGGEVFKTVGDGFCTAFTSAGAALRAAVAIERALIVAHWSIPEPLRVRLALHTGTPEMRGDDYFGQALNRTARILAAAHGDQILLSATTAELVTDDLPHDISLRDLGEFRLRDLLHADRLFQLVAPDIPGDFPPLRTLEMIRTNLPAEVTSFVGRAQARAEVRRALETTRLMTLTGSGGVGKTRLALRVAADLIEKFADGVWLVELAPVTDPQFVVRVVANAIGVREEPGQPLDALLQSYLQQRRLLLILDNCEHLMSACATLIARIMRTCPGVSVMTTSRAALEIEGEVIWRVPSLAMPPETTDDYEALLQSEALQLFADRAAAVRPGFAITEQNAQTIARICRQLDGIPLALELAAVRVRALAVEQIAARLDDRFRLLTGGSRTALRRQQTLKALIDWSYDMLLPTEQEALRRLAVCAGGWSIEAAEAICDGLPALDALVELVNKSLVVAEEGLGEARYRLLETIRQYGLERLREQEEEQETRARHMRFFTELVEAADRDRRVHDDGHWIDRLEAEHDNIQAALETATRHVEPNAALRIAVAFGWFWERRGYWTEGRQWLERALTGSGGDDGLRTRAHMRAGELAQLQSDHDNAQEHFDTALAGYRALGDAAGIAQAIYYQGMGAFRRGDHNRARELLEEGLAIARAAGEERVANEILYGIGSVHFAIGEYDRSRAIVSEYLASCRAAGNRAGIVRALNRLGYMAFVQGDNDTARALLDENIAMQRAMKSHNRMMTDSLSIRGQVAHDDGDYATARTNYREALSIRRDLRDIFGVTYSLERIAALAASTGRIDRAARLWGAAEALRERVGSPLLPAEIGTYQAEVEDAREQYDPDAFDRAWADGRTMSTDAAVALALE